MTSPRNLERMCDMSRYRLNREGRKEKDGFVTSSHTFLNAPNCVAVKRGDLVQVRDTKDEGDTTLSFTSDEWKAFVKGVKAGEFDI